MRLVVFGATGGTGANVVDRALADGHDVVAAVRHPDALPARARLAVLLCDVLDAAAVAAAMSDGDAVICAIGPASNRKPGTLISVGTSNLLAGCIASGINRFVFESGLMVSDGHELSTSGRFAVKMAGLVYPRLRADKVICRGSDHREPAGLGHRAPAQPHPRPRDRPMHRWTSRTGLPHQSDPARRLRGGARQGSHRASVDQASRQYRTTLTRKRIVCGTKMIWQRQPLDMTDDVPFAVRHAPQEEGSTPRKPSRSRGRAGVVLVQQRTRLE